MTVIPPSNKKEYTPTTCSAWLGNIIGNMLLKDPTSRNHYGQGTNPIFGLDAAGRCKADRYWDNDICLLRNELENTSQLPAGYPMHQMVVNELLLSWAQFEPESQRWWGWFFFPFGKQKIPPFHFYIIACRWKKLLVTLKWSWRRGKLSIHAFFLL